MKIRKIKSYILILWFCAALVPLNPNANAEKPQKTPEISNPILEIDEVVKEKDFLQEFRQSESTDVFRVFMKLGSSSNIRYLELMGSDLRTFSLYDGFLVTLEKKEIEFLISSNIAIEIWNNSILRPLYTDLSSNILDQSRSITNYIDMLDVNRFWDDSYYGAESKIAILDSGILPDHPALNETRNGQTKIVAMKNFFDNTSFPIDDYGHGTELAGIIGSNGNYGYPQGIAPDCQFLIGKILTNQGTGNLETLVDSISWAVENGADIINLSVGRYTSSLNSPDVEAVNNAVDAGVLVSVAAGNSRGKMNYGYSDLGTIQSPGIASKAITVGAIDNNAILYEHSSAGPVAVNYDEVKQSYLYDSTNYDCTWLKPDIVAPGVLINTTTNSLTSTRTVSGTSYAAAMISGIVALTLDKFPETKPSVVKAALLDCSQPINTVLHSPLNESLSIIPAQYYQGAGLVNLSLFSDFLLSPPLLTTWPSSLPFFEETFFVNSQHKIVLSLFANYENLNLKIFLSDTLKPVISELSLQEISGVSQYDLVITVNTEKVTSAIYSGNLSLQVDTSVLNIPVSIRVINAKARLLLDYFENGENIEYSPHGSIFPLIQLAHDLGYITSVIPKDVETPKFSDMNLNYYETIVLANPNGSSSITQPYDRADANTIVDYITESGSYKYPGALILLPSIDCDFDFMNSILSAYGITAQQTGIDSEDLDVSDIFSPILSSINDVERLYIPKPLELSGGNSSIRNVFDRFIYADLKPRGGSTLFVSNNIDMYLNTPYLYSANLKDYTETSVALNFGDNLDLLENAFYSTKTDFIFISTISDKKEFYLQEPVEIRVNISNYYKPMTGLEVSILFEKDGQTYIRYTDAIDFGNGTYSAKITASDYNVAAGNYKIYICTLLGTKSLEISILSKISFGALYVEIGLMVCIVVLISWNQKSNEKGKIPEK